jgi:alginate O-acetyltransferase complex protein AlgI
MAFQSLGILIGILAISCAARFIPAALPRHLLLLAASYFFYAQWAGEGFLLVLIASSLINYLWGSVLRRRPVTAFLWVGVGLNVLLLGFFKYIPTLAKQWPGAAGEDFLQHIILPLGISFWTFQGLSYLFDLYREEELDPSLLEFCLYMAFWPTVAAGPVSRLSKMLPQFRQPSTSVREDLSVGIVRIVQGLFMKFVLAHLLSSGLTVNGGVTAGFDEIAPARSGLDVWALAIGYGFQIFFDFAGYSNIVIGAARLMGIRLPENFNRPYLSTTPSIFWTRWHMSLSFWIRDYVFMPLATLRRDIWWPYAALAISMVIFGFWHDAKLTYIAWGIYHGALLVAHRSGQRLKHRIPFTLPHPVGIFLSWASTFLLVSLGYILFRANDLGQALRMLGAVIAPRFYALAYATLPHDYYLLVALCVVGYFTYVGVADVLVLWTTRCRENLRRSAEGVGTGAATGLPAVLGRNLLWVDGIVAERKWWWLTPVFVLLLMVTSLSFFSQSSQIAPFIYTLF